MRQTSLTALLIAAALGACNGSQSDAPGETPAQAETRPVDPATPEAGEQVESPPTVRAESAEDDTPDPVELRNLARDGTAATVSVTYDPAIEGFDPRLARRIMEASEEALQEFEAEAEAMGAGQGGPSPSHFLDISWHATWRGETVISLLREVSYYTGGAHPNASLSTLIWDREAGRQIGAGDLFAGEEAAYDALLGPLRARLVEARGERLEMGGLSTDELRGDVEEAVSREAGSLDRLAISSGENGAANGITVYFPPYEVAPYAEGSYVIDLPADLFTDALVPPYSAILTPG